MMLEQQRKAMVVAVFLESLIVTSLLLFSLFELRDYENKITLMWLSVALIFSAGYLFISMLGVIQWVARDNK